MTLGLGSDKSQIKKLKFNQRLAIQFQFLKYLWNATLAHHRKAALLIYFPQPGIKARI